MAAQLDRRPAVAGASGTEPRQGISRRRFLQGAAGLAIPAGVKISFPRNADAAPQPGQQLTTSRRQELPPPVKGFGVTPDVLGDNTGLMMSDVAKEAVNIGANAVLFEAKLDPDDSRTLDTFTDDLEAIKKRGIRGIVGITINGAKDADGYNDRLQMVADDRTFQDALGGDGMQGWHVVSPVWGTENVPGWDTLSIREKRSMLLKGAAILNEVGKTIGFQGVIAQPLTADENREIFTTDNINNDIYRGVVNVRSRAAGADILRDELEMAADELNPDLGVGIFFNQWDLDSENGQAMGIAGKVEEIINFMQRRRNGLPAAIYDNAVSRENGALYNIQGGKLQRKGGVSELEVLYDSMGDTIDVKEE